MSKGYEDKEPRRYERRTKTPEQALSSLMRLCARAEKSSGDALRLMRGWGVDEADSRRVLDTLIKQGFIDDARYADAYVREKMRLSGWGVYKIRQSLSAKGVPRDVAEQALSQYGRDDQRGRLQEMLEKKSRSVKAKDAYDLRAKLMRYGMSLGYEYADVADAVERVAGNG